MTNSNPTKAAVCGKCEKPVRGDGWVAYKGTDHENRRHHGC